MVSGYFSTKICLKTALTRIMMKLIVLLFAVFTVGRAQYDAETAFMFADADQDGEISDQEFVHYAAAVADYQKPGAVFAFTGDISVSTMHDVLSSLASPSDAFSVDDAVAFADSNDDGSIDGPEFYHYYQTMKYFKEATGGHLEDMVPLIYRFTGEISVEEFQSKLEEYEQENPTQSGYTVEQAVASANTDGDGFISATEFENWYNNVNHWKNEQLKAHMAGDDGVISKAEFIGVLNYISANYS
ncbi:uncharacterized protein [Apostichopus japonicus]|uniref:uncharacterized protein n=1 Tax=Stichopus japonicus TaxID=307972 RepID=UPI003AB3B88C